MNDKTGESAVARQLSRDNETKGYMSNWKHAPMTEITSQKRTRIRSDKVKRKQSGENESVRQMNTSGGWKEGRRGYQVKLHLEFSLFSLELWLKLVVGGRGGAAGQKDQRQLKVRIKIIRTAFYRRIMHALLFLYTVVMGHGFDSIKFCSCAKLWPRVWHGGGVGHMLLGGTGLRFQKGDSFQLAEVWVSVCLFAYGPKAKEFKMSRYSSGKFEIFKRGLTTASLIALVEAVGESVALPPARHTLPISTHEISRTVALCGDVIAWQQLALWWRRGKQIITILFQQKLECSVHPNGQNGRQLSYSQGKNIFGSTNIWLILCRYRALLHSNWGEERTVYIKCRYISMCPQRSKITTFSRNPEPWTSLRYFWLTQQLGQNGLECETWPLVGVWHYAVSGWVCDQKPHWAAKRRRFGPLY